MKSSGKAEPITRDRPRHHLWQDVASDSRWNRGTSQVRWFVGWLFFFFRYFGGSGILTPTLTNLLKCLIISHSTCL